MFDLEIQLIRDAICEDGILASRENVTNYRRVWSRDAMICGLAGLAIDDEIVKSGLLSSLKTLRRHQNSEGHIPSNVSLKNGTHVSYGTRVKRIDTNAWYLIGLCHFLEKTKQESLKFEFKESVEAALRFYQSIQSSNGIKTPVGGNWADDFPLEGVLIYDHVLYYWAHLCVNKIYGDELGLDLQALTGLREKFVNRFGNDQQWKVSLDRQDFDVELDLFGFSLAAYLDLGTSQVISNFFEKVENICRRNNLLGPPAFWPPIFTGDLSWALLQSISGPEFKNFPFEYHNGGLWPMLMGWWGLANWKAGNVGVAKKVLEQIEEINGNQFFEYLNNKTGERKGTVRCTWSAAASLLLRQQIMASKEVLLC